MRYLITFSYDGTAYAGYQKQPKLKTVEQELEKALFSINNHTETRVYASGRTDQGVHALGQTAHVDITVEITPYKFKCALNSLLPKDIHVIEVSLVEPEFHARFSAKEKIYIYKLNMGEYSPVDRHYIYQYNHYLDVEKMQEGIQYFVGTHDFQSFVSENCHKNSYVRTVYSATIKKEGEMLTFAFTGNGFMKYQVRNMVGTLINIGKGKLQPEKIKELLNNFDQKKFVTTAKPEGLYLKAVVY